MKQKVWRVAERLADDVFEHLLLSRDLQTDEQRSAFFSPDLIKLTSPISFSDMPRAVERIVRAIESKEKIVIWGDFDADGVTSTAILWETLHQLGAMVMPYIPGRDSEGHGFSDIGLQKLHQDGTQLIITVDHGITAIDEVEQIRSLGMEVIISDHHEPRLRQEGEGRREKGEVGSNLSTVDSRQSTKTSNPRTLEPSHRKYELPNAVAVIHPELMEEPQSLAGCGVSYLLAYAVWLVQGKGGMSVRHASQLSSQRRREYGGQVLLKADSRVGVADREMGKVVTKVLLEQLDTNESREEFASGKIELAGIGTIADMMPLKGDNRIFATHGLAHLRSTERLGLQRMMQLAGLQDKESLGVYDVGFAIGPRLNAPGRLADALESLRLLCTKDERRAGQLAQELDALNRHRQDLLVKVTEEAKVEAAKRSDGVFVLANADWPAGVCGLAAGKIVEQYHRPAVVMEIVEDGKLARGSARSIRGFDITAALTDIQHDLKSFGGHAMAAGFVAEVEKLAEIERKLSQRLFEQLSMEELEPSLVIDAEVGVDVVDWQFYEQLQQLEPCGMGNPRPVFVMRDVEVVNLRAVGSEGKHLKLTLKGASGKSVSGQEIELHPRTLAPSHPIDAIAFNLGFWAEKLSVDSKVDVVFSLDKNEWNGRKSLQLMVKDIRLTT